MAVTPQPRANGEYITVTSGQQLAVKVEGVIQHGSRAGLFRSVERVTITLTTHPAPRPNSNEKVSYYFNYSYINKNNHELINIFHLTP